MKRSGLGPVVTALFLILVLSTFVFLFGRGDTDSKPSSASTYPGGLGGFADLLRQEGFDVVIDRYEKPHLRGGDLAVAAFVEESGQLSPKTGPPERTTDRLEHHLAERGRVLELRFPRDFTQASRTAARSRVVDSSEPPVPFDLTVAEAVASGLGLPQSDPGYPAWTNEDGPFVTVCALDDGVLTIVSSAIGACNRFLAKDDNAVFYTNLVRRLVKPGGRVVFVEATIGEFDSEGLLANFGPWAVTAQWQALFLIVSVVFSVSRRFGQPVEDRTVQRGARQLLDAVAEVFRTSKKHEFAAKVLADSALDSVRAGLRLAPGSSKDEILAVSSLEFADAYSRIADAASGTLSAAATVEAVRDMQDAIVHSGTKN